MDEDEAQELIAKGEVWKPELKDEVKPRVYYLNLPKKFIAGTLYEPVEEEVVIGATATLKARRRHGAHHRDRRYGDFWFEGIDDGVYDLELKSRRQDRDLHRPGHHRARHQPRRHPAGVTVRAARRLDARPLAADPAGPLPLPGSGPAALCAEVVLCARWVTPRCSVRAVAGRSVQLIGREERGV